MRTTVPTLPLVIRARRLVQLMLGAVAAMLSGTIGFKGLMGLWAVFRPAVVPDSLSSVPAVMLSMLTAGLCALFAWKMWFRASGTGMIIPMTPFLLFSMALCLIYFLMLTGGLRSPLPSGLRAAILGLASVGFWGMRQETNRKAKP